ncbi:MAG: energy transducer TonB [Arenicellales bacterium]
MSVYLDLASGATTATIRWLVGIVLAAFVTVGLLWSMQYLISTADQSLDESKAGNILDFVRLKREEIVRRKNNKPEKPPAPKAPPPEPPAPKLDKINAKAEKISISAVKVDTEVDLSAEGFSLNIGEGDYLPIVKVAPIYPRRALSRGIEGYVMVEFTVTSVGKVKDVVVVESKPTSKIFHKAAINATMKFKYKPRVIDGVAMEVGGVRNIIRFKLED